MGFNLKKKLFFKEIQHWKYTFRNSSTFQEFLDSCVPKAELWVLNKWYSWLHFIIFTGPSTMTILYSYAYIFKMMFRYHRNQSKGRKALHCGGLMNEALCEPSNMMTFILIILFLVSWTPWICFRLYEQITQQEINYPILQFIISWVGIANSFWKVIIYVTMSRKIRRRVIRMLLHISCFVRCSSASTIISNVWIKGFRQLYLLVGSIRKCSLCLYCQWN